MGGERTFELNAPAIRGHTGCDFRRDPPVDDPLSARVLRVIFDRFNIGIDQIDVVGGKGAVIRVLRVVVHSQIAEPLHIVGSVPRAPVSGRFSGTVVAAASRAGTDHVQMVVPVFLNVIAQLDIGLEPEILPPRFVLSVNLGDAGVGNVPCSGLHGSERRGRVLCMFGLEEESYGRAAGGQGKGQSGIRAVVGCRYGRCAQYFCRHRAFHIKGRAVRVGLLGDPGHRADSARALGDILHCR